MEIKLPKTSEKNFKVFIHFLSDLLQVAFYQDFTSKASRSSFRSQVVNHQKKKKVSSITGDYTARKEGAEKTRIALNNTTKRN